MPFLFASKHWEFDETNRNQAFYDEDHPYNVNDENFKENVYLHFYHYISPESYFVPDLTCAVNFIVHGKKLQNNFVFGININIGFMERMIVSYKYDEDFFDISSS